MKNKLSKTIFLVTLLIYSVVLTSCAHKAEILDLQSKSSPSIQTVQNNSDSGLLIKNDCYENSSSNGFLRCLTDNKINISSEIDSINKIIIEKIENQFNDEGIKLDERFIAEIQYQKEVFSKSIINWNDFAKEDCKFPAKSKTAENSFFSCYNERVELRLKDLYDHYFIANDDDLRRKKRDEDWKLLKKMPCDKTNIGGTIEINDCETQRLEKAEKRLNELISKIQAALPSNAQITPIQQKWSDFIENHCRAIVNYENPFGSANASMNIVCVDVATEKRIAELENLFK